MEKDALYTVGNIVVRSRGWWVARPSYSLLSFVIKVVPFLRSGIRKAIILTKQYHSYATAGHLHIYCHSLIKYGSGSNRPQIESENMILL
jgi:hypothetical protein